MAAKNMYKYGVKPAQNPEEENKETDIKIDSERTAS
jgi:hypothetical protein